MVAAALAALGLALAVSALTACAGLPGGGGSDAGGAPPSPNDGRVDVDGAAPSAEPEAAWLDDGRAVGIVTWGSSSRVPTAVAGYADGVLEVTLFDAEAEICTADLAPRVSHVALPDGVDRSHDLEIQIGFDADADSGDAAG